MQSELHLLGLCPPAGPVSIAHAQISWRGAVQMDPMTLLDRILSTRQAAVMHIHMPFM